jgi:hypothetical protein
MVRGMDQCAAMRGGSLGIDLGGDRGVAEPLVSAPKVDAVGLPPPGCVAPKVPASVQRLALVSDVSGRPAAPGPEVGPGACNPSEKNRGGNLRGGPLSRMFRRMSQMARGSGRI